MTKQIHARTIQLKPPGSMAVRYDAGDSPKHQALIAKIDERKRLIAIADKIAEHTFYYRNWKWPDADQHFPNHVDLRFVDKCYPYAKGGMLLVDEPRDSVDADQSYMKQKLLKKLGIRHIVLEDNPATTLYDALEQLGDI
jgi:hypothetical protein